MAEELQTGVCGENWWTRSGFMASPCSVSLNDFGWPSTDQVVDMKTKYSTYNGDTISNSVSDQSSLSFQDHIVNQKPNQHHQVSDSESSGSILIDSTSQMMGFGLSTTSTPISDFNQPLLNKKVESNNNFHSRFQEEVETKLNYRPEICLTAASKLQNDWSPNSQDLSSGFPISSSPSFGYRTNTNTNTNITTSTTTSKLLQGLFDSESQPNQSSFGSSTISASFPGLFSSNSIMRPKQLQHGGFNFSNNTPPFWNDSVTSLNDIRGGPFSSSQSQFLAPTFEEKPNFHILSKKGNTKQEIQDSAGSVVKKSGSGIINHPVMKRPRIETPSPLPTFKVRKEKLGDRITALQQLVSPFGKTDTASVLHEAIEYIKFLHDQVGTYLKNGASNNINPRKELLQGYDNMKEPECPKEDLKSRGLCLVPISSSFPVGHGNETTADFWTPTFGSSFR